MSIIHSFIPCKGGKYVLLFCVCLSSEYGGYGAAQGGYGQQGGYGGAQDAGYGQQGGYGQQVLTFLSFN